MVGEASIVKTIITVYEGITEEGASFLLKLHTVRRPATSLKMSSLFLNIFLKS